jgi:hypothetical protein
MNTLVTLAGRVADPLRPINIWYNIYCELIVWIVRWGLMQVSVPRSGLDDFYDLKLSHDVTKS